MVVAVLFSLLLVLFKVTLVVWFERRMRAVRAAGNLPSTIIARATAATPDGLPMLNAYDSNELIPRLHLPLPFRAGPTNSSGASMQNLISGDLDRYGWQVQLQVRADGRAAGWSTTCSDEVAAGTPTRWTRAFIVSRNLVSSWLALAVLGGTVAALIGWPFGWRRAIALPTFGLALVLSTACLLSGRPSRVFFSATMDVAPWVPLFLLVPAAALACWPTAKRAVDPARCSTCGYDLTGNLSGVCPECGTAKVAPTLAVDSAGS